MLYKKVIICLINMYILTTQLTQWYEFNYNKEILRLIFNVSNIAKFARNLCAATLMIA
jgi:hypothetical protein